MSGLEERVAGLALGDDGSREAALRRLQGCGDARVGWPREKPGVAANAEGWFLRANEDVLRDLVPRGGLVLQQQFQLR